MDISSDIIGNSPVRLAIADASKKTGMDFKFLLATATRESSLNPNAEARTSSATGLFQFLDQTWLNTLKRHGAEHGLSEEANAISIDGSGRASVSDSSLKRKLLDLRYDPKISSLMAAEFAADNADYIKSKTGQDPQAGDLYAAHFLGAGGAAQLINAANSTPWVKAASLFPSAASANRPVFYDDGRALSVAEVLEDLRATASKANPAFNNNEFKVRNAAIDYDDLSNSAAKIFLSSMNNGMDYQALGILNGNINLGNNNGFNPLLLAQMYQASDNANQAKAMEIAIGALNGNSIADALLPNAGQEEPKKSSGGIFGFRGTQ